MHRLRRLNVFWRWLPVFRAVAETGHLHEAARLLCVSAPAVSRTIRQLEAAVGRSLFDRTAGRIVLNSAGATLLSTTRDAMRLVDDAVGGLGEVGLMEEVRVGCIGVGAVSVVGAMMAELAGTMTLQVHQVSPELIDRCLLTGQLDVAIVEVLPPRIDRTLACRRLTGLDRGVFCGPGHPLHDAPHPLPALCLEHGFVALVSSLASEVELDGWPPELARRVGARVSDAHALVELCAAGTYLAVLPEGCASRGDLRRLPMPAVEPAVIHALYRAPLRSGMARPCDRVVDAAARLLAQREFPQKRTATPRG